MPTLQRLPLFALALLLGACQSTSQPRVLASSDSTPTAQTPTASSAAPAVTFGGGKGLSTEDAVVVHAPNEFLGVRAEYRWLREHFPGYKRKSQAVTPSTTTKRYDVLEIELPDGKNFKVYFEISEFYGKS